MKEMLLNYLKKYKKTNILLQDLEKIFTGKSMSYERFANIIVELEEDGILTMIATKGRNNKIPSLAYQYRIVKAILNKDYLSEISQLQVILHPKINLDRYYSFNPIVWEKDLPYIKKINEYLIKNGLPNDYVPAPERSYELVGDEKWLIEKGGKELLERLDLWIDFKIINVADPLMFAINPNTFKNNEHLHLIVENKTTYEALLDILNETPFTTIIYGSGKKIIKSVEHLNRQLQFKNVKHKIYYFGDLDFEGILIWYLLNRKYKSHLALPFYRACLEKEYTIGKQNQKKNNEAYNQFIENFTKEEQKSIIDMFSKGGYFPQEVLKTEELREIWRKSLWK